MFEGHPIIFRRYGVKRDRVLRRPASGQAGHLTEGLPIITCLQGLLWSSDSGHQLLNEVWILRYVRRCANRVR